MMPKEKRKINKSQQSADFAILLFHNTSFIILFTTLTVTRLFLKGTQPAP
jgi:hypothetical protein